MSTQEQHRIPAGFLASLASGLTTVRTAPVAAVHLARTDGPQPRSHRAAKRAERSPHDLRDAPVDRTRPERIAAQRARINALYNLNLSESRAA